MNYRSSTNRTEGTHRGRNPYRNISRRIQNWRMRVCTVKALRVQTRQNDCSEPDGGDVSRKEEKVFTDIVRTQNCISILMAA